MHRVRGLIALCWAIVMISGCGGRENDGPKEGHSSDSLDSLGDALKSETLGASTDSVQLLPFEKALIPDPLDFEGSVVDGKHWKDKEGEHWLVISERHHGMVADEDFLVSIFGRAWRMEDGMPVMEWEIKEYNQNVFSGPEYADQSLEIMDLDGNGVAESAFMYRIDTDGAGPCGVKLLMHVNDKKYAIRGQLAGMDYDRGKVEEKHIDPTFQEIAPKFRDYASEKWDAYERAYYKGWPEGVD